jgi:hypothetical protein
MHVTGQAPTGPGREGVVGGKMCPKTILEGTRLTLKTELAFTLNEHPRIVGPRRCRYHSSLVSAELCALTNHPWGRGQINFAPEEEALALDTYRTSACLSLQLRYYSWIIDRFQLSTRTYQLQHHARDTILSGWRTNFGRSDSALRSSPAHRSHSNRPAQNVSGSPGSRISMTTFSPSSASRTSSAT